MHTPNDAEFLIPPRMDGFQLHSLRRVWVDWQQGAAVMWSPAFYARWSGRFSDTLKLKSHREFNNYARAHDLPYYVMARNGPAGG